MMTPKQAETSLGTRVVVAGVSARAAAESAARAGFAVTAIDAFADLDQAPSVHALSVPAGFTAQRAARLAKPIACDAVAYLSSFENHPRAVSTLSTGRVLWGNPPAVLRRVRDPIVLAEVLRDHGCAAPAATLSAASGPDLGRTARQWLVKPIASGGGHRVRLWRRAARVPRGCYLQEFVDGTPGSVVFVAAAGRVLPLGVSRQLVGDPAFGGSGYRYCGSILAADDDGLFGRGGAIVEQAYALARAVAETFDLVGVNGIDFVASGGVPYAIEVNPRWSSSMELVERASGLSVFGAHAAACTAGVLPAGDVIRGGRFALGKAVVFARRDVVVGDSRAWLADSTVRDVPHPGESIPAGRPVCTVFAAARDSSACYDALVLRAAQVYAALATWEQAVA